MLRSDQLLEKTNGWDPEDPTTTPFGQAGTFQVVVRTTVGGYNDGRVVVRCGFAVYQVRSLRLEVGRSTFNLRWGM